MGVTGCGKTTIGKLLAERLGWTFLDADDYHPAANREKMRAAIPLTDADREPWLRTLARVIDEKTAAGERVVLGCSALKERYRVMLRGDHPERWLIAHLVGSFDLLSQRLGARTHAYMNPALLQSQFDALEPPPEAVELQIGEPPAVLVEQLAQLVAQ